MTAFELFLDPIVLKRYITVEMLIKFFRKMFYILTFKGWARVKPRKAPTIPMRCFCSYCHCSFDFCLS